MAAGAIADAPLPTLILTPGGIQDEKSEERAEKKVA